VATLNVAADPDLASCLRQSLGSQASRFAQIEARGQVESSNSELLSLPPGAPTPVLLLAHRQIAGRGRHGRGWNMPSGGQLAMSLALDLPLPPRSIGLLPIAAGIATAEALRELGLREIRLKWPNDLYLDEAKLGGILVELGRKGGCGSRCVVGIGINRRLPDRLPAALADLDPAPTDLFARLGDATPELEPLAARVALAILDAAMSLAMPEAIDWSARFAVFDLLVGREVGWNDAQGNAMNGRADGIAADGRLRVERAGAVELLGSGEVSQLRPRLETTT